jgi:hypothetical protein
MDRYQDFHLEDHHAERQRLHGVSSIRTAHGGRPRSGRGSAGGPHASGLDRAERPRRVAGASGRRNGSGVVVGEVVDQGCQGLPVGAGGGCRAFHVSGLAQRDDLVVLRDGCPAAQ